MTPRTGAHLTHDELSTPAEMARDCAALTAHVPGLARALATVAAPAPSLAFADYPAELPKRGEINVDAAAVRLANALHLHLD